MKISPHGHLTYCTNIHPGESWEEVRSSLHHVLDVKRRMCPDRPFGIGLRLSARAAAELTEPERLQAFKSWLDRHDCYVFTMNGFPYGGFHGERVKDQVHAPDWRSRERVTYTKQLFDMLAELLPEGLDGGVSTSPLSYKPWLGAGAREAELSGMREHLLDVIDHLADLRNRTGKDLHLDLEPEPDGLIENTAEFVDLYRALLAQGRESDVRRHFAICYDVCHFAVAYESPEASLRTLTEEGIRIGRLQISAALKADLHGDRAAVRTSLQPYDEPVYLHQAALRRSDGSIDRFPDLAPALEALDDPNYRELRTHFHVPIYTESYGRLQSTNDAIREALRIWKARPFTPHLEVETYTWDVLPDHQRLNLTESIARELEWVRGELAD
ncbi:xylose isomerase-like TIM barrel protein [Neolewinella xylanilytica]|uniref:Xylose isomerase-like TIM barrel protein n=2 Tax=Neolewinella xylanilytica TaxID=1514080 RepID=A0A2S6IBF2_9BACT|nr:xylose isomerase-like TIM barrel protein [Neolewinella xylanilytica]